MTVLIASDLSVRTGPALRRGLMIAHDLGESAEVVHVVAAELPAELRDKLVDWAKTALARDAGEEAVALGVPSPEITVLVGNPKRDIALHAYRSDASLIVLGTHDPSKDGFFGFGHTTAGLIVRNTHLPVLLVRSPALEAYHDVLIGVDFSVFSTTAVRHALRIMPDARLHLVHAYQVPFRSRLGTDDYIAAVEAQSRASLETYVRQEIDELADRVRRQSGKSTSIHTHLVEGAAKDALEESRKRLSAEPIVIGTHGASGVLRAIWGSLAQSLLDHPPCDILVVHDT